MEESNGKPTYNPMIAYAQGLIKLDRMGSPKIKEFKDFPHDDPAALAPRLRGYAKYLIERDRDRYQTVFLSYIKKILRFNYASFQNAWYQKECLGSAFVDHDLISNQLLDYKPHAPLTIPDYLKLEEKIEKWWNKKGFDVFIDKFASTSLCGLELVPLLEELPIKVFIYNIITNKHIVVNLKDEAFWDLLIPQASDFKDILNDIGNCFIELSFLREEPKTKTITPKDKEVTISIAPRALWQIKSACYFNFDTKFQHQMLNLITRSSSGPDNLIPTLMLINKIKEPIPSYKIVRDAYIRSFVFFAGTAGAISSILSDSNSTFDIPRLLSPITNAAASWFTLLIATMLNINKYQKRLKLKPEIARLIGILTIRSINYEDDIIMVHLDTGDIAIIKPNESAKYKDLLKDNYVALGYLSSLKAFKPFRTLLTPYFKLFASDFNIYMPAIVIQLLSLIPIGVGLSLAIAKPEDWGYIGPALGMVLGALAISYIFELLSDLTAAADIRLFNRVLEKIGGKGFYNHEADIYNQILNMENSIKRHRVKDIHQTVPSDVPEIAGLKHRSIPGNGHCLFNAVAIHLGIDQKSLRENVARYLEEDNSGLRDFIQRGGRSIQQYISEMREGIEWASHVEIEILMRLLKRPILVIESTGKITNFMDANRFSGEPIFVYYNGYNHYDAFVLEEGANSQTILASLLTQSMTQPSATTTQTTSLSNNRYIFSNSQNDEAPTFVTYTPG